MSSVQSLLPPNAQPVERQLEQFSARLVGVTDPLRALWRPEMCPPRALPWLAWSMSVDDWGREWPEATKRAAVAASIGIHRRKGTVQSVRDAIAAFGYGEAIILEGLSARFHDGSFAFDGSEQYSGADHWAEYRVYLERPITIDQADELRRILANVAPARCHLKGLYFTEANHRYNAAISYSGTHTHGVA